MIQAHGDNIQMKLRKIFPGSFKEEMADFTMTLDPFNDIVRTVTLDTDDDGTLVFTVNGVRSKKPPPEWDEMNATLTKGRDMVLNYKGNADEVDISVVKNLTDILKNAGKDPDIAERVITLLNHYGTNDENLKKIERAGGIEALIEALRQHPDNDRLAKALLLLLDKFCDHDVFKTRIGKAGAVEVILSACNAQSSAAKVANGRSLPKGWVAVRDPKSNKTYYYNTVTRKSTLVLNREARQHLSLSLSLYVCVCVCVFVTHHVHIRTSPRSTHMTLTQITRYVEETETRQA